MKSWLMVFCKIVLGVWITVASLTTIHLWRSTMAVGSSDFLWEFSKVILGPFVGAGLAFLANDLVHKRRKLEDEKSAARSAAFAIRAIYDDFVNYRYAIRTQTATLDQSYSKLPDAPAPLWAYAKPLIATFSAVGPPDLKSLHFLLAHPDGQQAFTKMQVLERAYKNLADAHSLYNATAEEVQIKIDGIQSISWDEDGKSIGARLTANARDLFLAVLVRISDEPLYQDTYAALLQASETHFKGSPVKGALSVDDAMKSENLPPLPEHIGQYIEQNKLG